MAQEKEGDPLSRCLTEEQLAALERFEARYGDEINPNLCDTRERAQASRVCTPGDLAKFTQKKK